MFRLSEEKKSGSKHSTVILFDFENRSTVQNVVTGMCMKSRVICNVSSALNDTSAEMCSLGQTSSGFLKSRNIGLVTPKNIYFHYLIKK